MYIDDFKIEHPRLWNTFFWFAGMASLFIWNSILSLSQYWNTKFKDGIDAYFPFFYFAGSFCNFFVFDCINKVLPFKLQLWIIPSFMALCFYLEFLVAETMKGDDLENSRVTIFLVIIFLQGFANNILQTSLGRFCFNFRVNDITNYSSGTALIGILCAILAFI